jgi:hypothetical protein
MALILRVQLYMHNMEHVARLLSPCQQQETPEHANMYDSYAEAPVLTTVCPRCNCQ